MILTQRELNKAVCSNPSCNEEHGPLVLHARCHPDAGTWAVYDKGTGVLSFRCGACEQKVVEVAVARDASEL
jgi:hypothetical protein